MLLPSELLLAYRKIVASTSDEEVHWWYFGTSFVEVEGHLRTPIFHPETLMVYRTETLSPTQFRIHWREVGYFRDPVTGDVAQSWLNPLNGQQIRSPQFFAEGPGHYTITATTNGLEVALSQPHAQVRSVEVKFNTDSTRIAIVQTERKVRGFPNQDGSLPSVGSGGAEAQTTLAFYADQGAVSSPGVSSAPCSGSYDFVLDCLPPWVGLPKHRGRTLTTGVIAKCGPHETVNLLALQRLKKQFPDFFAKSP
jgi:hypothetical protein